MYAVYHTQFKALWDQSSAKIQQSHIGQHVVHNLLKLRKNPHPPYQKSEGMASATVICGAAIQNIGISKDDWMFIRLSLVFIIVWVVSSIVIWGIPLFWITPVCPRDGCPFGHSCLALKYIPQSSDIKKKYSHMIKGGGSFNLYPPRSWTVRPWKVTGTQEEAGSPSFPTIVQGKTRCETSRFGNISTKCDDFKRKP